MARYLAVAIACVFLTGFAALVYEICWIREATLAFGSTTWAVSAVLAIFFLGLALGSFLAGKYSGDLTRPLRVCGWLELGVAVVAILSPSLFRAVDLLFGALYPHIVHSVVMLALVRLLVATVVIFPATVLMGGSLPLFCHQFVRRSPHVSRGVGILYAANTLGAVAGSAACGFWLIPRIGIATSIYTAGVINLIVGVVALRLGANPALRPARAPSGPAEARDGHVVPGAPRRAQRLLAFLFFGVGFVGLANEVLWTRFLALWMPNTVYTYTLTLTTVLAGIVLGSLLAAAVGDKLGWKAGLFGAAQVANGLAVIGIMQARPQWWGPLLNPVGLTAQLVVIAAVMLIPAVLSGLSFPLAVRLVVPNAARTGRGVGTMLACNMVGGVVGSLAIGFLTLPLLGMQATLLLTTGLSILIGAIAWWRLERRVFWLWRAAATASAVAAWVAIPLLCGTQLPRDYLAIEGQLVDYREGIGNDVAIIRKAGDLWLEINRMWQGQGRKNHQVLAAHIPALLHGNPKSVLVIGLGSGQTARSFLVHPIRRLDCVEIERGLVELVKQYYDAAWMQDARVHMIIEDGRNYVAHTDQAYDLISIEVGQIYRPGVAAFYTADFYDRVRARLRAGGVVCQFLPIEFFGPDEFRTLVAAFQHVFPQCALWYNTSELLLIGTKSKSFHWDRSRFVQRLASNPRLRRDLSYAYWGGKPFFLSRPEVFLAGFLCGPEQLRALARGTAIYRDDRPYLEYVTLLGRPGAAETIAQLRPHLAPPAAIAATLTGDQLAEVLDARELNLEEITAHVSVNRGRALQRAGQIQAAIAAYTRALRVMPVHPVANYQLATILKTQGNFREAIPHYRQVLVTKPHDFRALRELAIALARTGQTAPATQQFRAALAERPDDATSNRYLAALLQARGHVAEAIMHYRRAVAGAPDDVEARVNLARALLASGQFDQAIAAYRKAAQLAPKDDAVMAELGTALVATGRLDQALQLYRKALALDPTNAETLAAAAWILATHPDPAKRDAKQALTWARQAVQRTDSKSPLALDVLAAAQAADGNFTRAAATAQRALDIATRLGMTKPAAQIRQHLALYRAGKPFVQR